MLVRFLGSCCATSGFLRLWQPKAGGGSGIRDADDEYGMPKALLPPLYDTKKAQNANTSGIMSCVVEEDEEEESQRPSEKADTTVFKFDDVPTITKQPLTDGVTSLEQVQTIDRNNISIERSGKSGFNNLLSLRNVPTRAAESISYRKSFAGSTNVGSDGSEANVKRENTRCHSDSNLTRRVGASLDLGSLTSLRRRLNAFLLSGGRKMLWVKEDSKGSNTQQREMTGNGDDDVPTPVSASVVIQITSDPITRSFVAADVSSPAAAVMAASSSSTISSMLSLTNPKYFGAFKTDHNSVSGSSQCLTTTASEQPRRASCTVPSSAAGQYASGNMPAAAVIRKRECNSFSAPQDANAVDLAERAVSVARQQPVLGRLRVAVQYSQQKKLLILTVVELTLNAESSYTNGDASGSGSGPSAEDIGNAAGNPSASTNDGGYADPMGSPKGLNCQIRLTLLSDKVVKHRTKFRNLTLQMPSPALSSSSGSPNAGGQQQPVNATKFNETFVFTLLSDELKESVIRLRAYQKRLASGALLGEAFFRAAVVDPNAGGVSTVHVLKLRAAPIYAFVNASALISGGGGSTSNSTMSLFPPLLSRAATGGSGGNNSTSNGSPQHSSSPSHHQHNLHHHHSQQQPIPSSLQLLMGGGGSAKCLGMPAQTSQAASGTTGSGSGSTPASRRNSTVDDCGRFCSLPQSDGTPEVLISLCYLESQSKLIVVVEKAIGLDSAQLTTSSYTNLSANNPTSNPSRVPDTFVRVSALSALGVELDKHKSETMKGGDGYHTSVTYHETVVFQVPRADLDQSSVLIQVFSQCGAILRRRTLLGWVRIGGGSGSVDAPDAAARQHWLEMMQGMGITVDKWHHLIKTPYQQQQILRGNPA